MSERIRSLQILRFVAAGMVATAHAGWFANSLAAGRPLWAGLWESTYSGLGSAGVDIFFLISGAIIYLSAFAGPRPSAGEFLRKRFLRIVPIYYLVTLAWLPFAPLAGEPLISERIATSFLFWPAWGSAIFVPMYGTGWTLCFELLFYIAAAAALSSRSAAPVILCLYAAAWIARAKLGGATLEFLGNPIAAEFLLGIAVAALWHKGRAPRGLAAAIMVEVGFAALVIFRLPPLLDAPLRTLSGEEALQRLFCWGIPSGLILWGTLGLEPLTRMRWLRPAGFLGDASYSIYLAQWPILAFLSWASLALGLRPPVLLAWSIATALCFAIGALVFYFMERPLNRTLRAWLTPAKHPLGRAADYGV